MVGKIDLSNQDGLNEAAQKVLASVMTGDTSVADAKEVFSLMRSYSGLKMQEEVAALEAMVRDAEEKSKGGGAVIPEGSMPVWGRLTEE
jgi:hypothetical protein